MPKSKRKKLKLYVDCRKKLFLLTENWKETPGLEEERIFKKFKETTMKERIVEELGRSTNTSNANPKPNVSKTPTLVLNPSKKKSNLEDSKKKPRKTTLTTLMSRTEMKKTGRGPGRNSPMANKVASQHNLKQTPNMKRQAEIVQC